MVLVACESHEQKADDAFENVKEKKAMMKDSVTKELVPDSVKTEPLKEIERPDEWTQFKTETEKKIASNEIKIKKIKSIHNANAKLMKQVMSLEKDNNELRKEMDVYKEEVKVMWENFKTKINHDVNEISIELKDLTINNKK
jgi:hypothetical protein